MARLIFLLLLIFFIQGGLFSQNTIDVFEGGKHKMDMSFYSTFFMGQTAKSRNYGNTISGSVFDTHLISSNPAALTRAHRNLLTFDLAVGFGLDINNIYSGLQDQMNTFVDDTIGDDASDEIRKSYPNLTTDMGQSGWVNQFGIVVHDETYGTFGFSWHRPFYLDLNYIGNAMNFTVTDRVLKDEGTDNEYVETTVLPLSIELFSNTGIYMHQSDFAYARKIDEHLSVGANLSFSNLTMKSSLNGNIGGFIRQHGGNNNINESFDNPNSNYRDTLNSSINADLKGNLWGMTLSTSYSHTEKIVFDVALTTSRSTKMKGSLHVVQHTLYALNMNAKDGEKTFDVEKLQPAMITYTNRTEYISNDIKVKTPGSFAIAASFSSDDHYRFIIGYEVMFSEISLDYKCARLEDGIRLDRDGIFENYDTETTLRYKVGIKPKHTIKLALGCDHFALSAQLTIADLIADHIKDKKGNQVDVAKNVIIPGLGLGTTFAFTKDLAMDLSLMAIPAPFLRSSISWKF